jgi:hypothetical protein
MQCPLCSRQRATVLDTCLSCTNNSGFLTAQSNIHATAFVAARSGWLALSIAENAFGWINVNTKQGGSTELGFGGACISLPQQRYPCEPIK